MDCRLVSLPMRCSRTLNFSFNHLSMKTPSLEIALTSSLQDFTSMVSHSYLRLYLSPYWHLSYTFGSDSSSLENHVTMGTFLRWYWFSMPRLAFRFCWDIVGVLSIHLSYVISQ